MAALGELVLQICPEPDDDAAELAQLTGWLRGELLGLDVQDAAPLPGGAGPSGAKGVAAVAGWLSVQLGPAALQAVLARVADWARRNERLVEVSYGDDTLKLGRATRDQQEKIVDDWLARHQTAS